ncbi:nucleotide-binding oligomerization domain-containing protein 1-like isoform X2 [Oculina patagonica]
MQHSMKESLIENLKHKTFSPFGYFVNFFWVVAEITLTGVFADIESSESRFDFHCAANANEKDLGKTKTAKCLEQYRKLYNKLGVPVFAFVVLNFFLIASVCVVYSLVVKSRVDKLLKALGNGDAENQPPPVTRKLFKAYCCQLGIKLVFGIIFIFLQTQLFYPSNFPPSFECNDTPESSKATNASASNIQNMTKYTCQHQRAEKKTFWAKAVIVVNVILILFILIEFFCIVLCRVRKGREFLNDSNFLKVYLRRQQHQQQEQAQVLLEETVSLSSYIRSLKGRIMQCTDKLQDLEPHFNNAKQGEGKTPIPEFEGIYTNVVLIENRAEYDFSENRLRYNNFREEALSAFPIQNKDYQGEIRCQPLERPEDIVDKKGSSLIIGRPGIGKTLLCTKFLRGWASDKLFNSTQDSIVFLIKLRRFNSEENRELNLRELLDRAEFLPERLPDEAWKYILDNPEKVLILFDGLDEYKDHSKIAAETVDRALYPKDTAQKRMPIHSLYFKVVSGELLPRATVLTTTRATAVSSLEDLNIFDNTFEILGFTTEQVDKYVENFTKKAEEKLSGVGEKMKTHIRGNANILSLCYIPVNCFIICCSLLRDVRYHTDKLRIDLNDVSLPTKLTSLYRKAMRLFFFERNKKYSHLSRKEIESDELPREAKREEKQQFKLLGKIAFKGIEEGRLIFTKSEVLKVVNSSLFYQMRDHHISPDKTEEQFCFMHLTIQEYFAAKHITDTMNEAELRTFVEEHIDEGEWQVVLQFVAGLLGERDEQLKIFTDLLPEETEEKNEWQLMDTILESEQRTFTCWPTKSEKHLALTIIKCIHEGSESNVVQSKLKNIRFNAVDFSDCRLAPANCTAIVHVFKHVQQISLINLYDNNIGPLGGAEITKLFDNDNSQLTGLNLWGNRIGDEGVKQLSKVIVKSNLELLNLGGNSITDKGLNYLSDKLVNTKVKSLDLGGNNITDKGLNYLSDKLVNTNVKSLDLSDNNITDKGLNYLSDKLVNTKVESLNLGGNNITDKGLNYLMINL